MAPLRHGLDIKATVFTWSITTDIRANLLSARFSKRAPAATRILFSACCRDHDDTGANELTDRICRVRRPVDIPAPPRRAGGFWRALNSAPCCFLFTPISHASLDRSAFSLSRRPKTGAAANTCREQSGAGAQAQVIRTALAPWSRSHLGLWFDIGLRFDIGTAYRCQRWRTSKIYLFGKFFGFFPLVILML